MRVSHFGRKKKKHEYGKITLKIQTLKMKGINNGYKLIIKLVNND